MLGSVVLQGYSNGYINGYSNTYIWVSKHIDHCNITGTQLVTGGTQLVRGWGV